MTGPRKIAALVAVASAVWASAPARAQNDPPADTVSAEEPVEKRRPTAAEELAVLMDAIRDPAAANPERLEGRIIELWSDSGSATADYLLRRGRDAMNAEDFRAAIGHLTALTDHAPAFAEGWNARATAFFMMDEFGLALSDIERALALNPDHFGALAGMGIILEQMDRPGPALAAFRAAQTLNPHRERVNDSVRRLAPMVDGRDL
jgi:tetratricopeptide (TPR) repeat protein